MNIKIGEKNYEITYPFKAVMISDCVSKTLALFDALGNLSNGDSSSAIDTYSKIAPTAVTLFYAGCEKHNPLESEDEAAGLLEQYFDENPDTGIYEFIQEVFKQMSEDGFFRHIGLEQKASDQKKTPKKPADHKKKATQISEK